MPEGHPRVFLDSAELEILKAKVAQSSFAELYNKVKGSNKPLCKAFVSMLTADGTLAKEAIDTALIELKACTDARTPFNAMHCGACVYDWCYSVLTDKQKQDFITEFKRVAALHSPYFPARKTANAVVGHDCEAWLLTNQLPAGVAIYDEDSVMYDSAAALFFEKFVPVRNFHYASHMHHQGDSYIATRFQHDMYAAWLFRRMGVGHVFDSSQRYVPYQLMYHLRPDSQQMRSGDTYDDRGKSDQKRFCAMAAGAYYRDPYLLALADSDLFWSKKDLQCVFELLFRPSDASTQPLSQLPQTKYFPHPMGEMIARTGWEMGLDSKSAVVHMRIGNYFFGNHQHKDFGIFQIYYRGALAISSGIYEGSGSSYGSDHWKHYYHQTLSKNGLLIFDPNEAMDKGSANDGGQLWPNEGRDHPSTLQMLIDKANGYEMGTVMAHDFGPDKATPDYSYLAGDISKAYSPLKASLVTRSMVMLNTSATIYPCIFVVCDRVVSLVDSYKKTWLVHSISEPLIESQAYTIENVTAHYSGTGNYGGKLMGQSMLPKNAMLTKVGGANKEFWIRSTSKNYYTEKENGAEAGAWRIEISPSQPALSDVFLNVLAVMDASIKIRPQVTLVENDTIAAVRVLDRMVVFAKDDGFLTNFSITIGGTENVKLLVCDAATGTWTIKLGNAVYANAVVTDGIHTLYENCLPGTYHFAQTGSIARRNPIAARRRQNAGTARIYDIRGRFVSSARTTVGLKQHQASGKVCKGVYILANPGNNARKYICHQR